MFGTDLFQGLSSALGGGGGGGGGRSSWNDTSNSLSRIAQGVDYAMFNHPMGRYSPDMYGPPSYNYDGGMPESDNTYGYTTRRMYATKRPGDYVDPYQYGSSGGYGGSFYGGGYGGGGYGGGSYGGGYGGYTSQQQQQAKPGIASSLFSTAAPLAAIAFPEAAPFIGMAAPFMPLADQLLSSLSSLF